MYTEKRSYIYRCLNISWRVGGGTPVLALKSKPQAKTDPIGTVLSEPWSVQCPLVKFHQWTWSLLQRTLMILGCSLCVDNLDPGLEMEQWTIKERISDGVSCESIKNQVIAGGLGAWNKSLMCFKDISPLTKLRLKEQWSTAVVSQLSKHFRWKLLRRDSERCSWCGLCKLWYLLVGCVQILVRRKVSKPVGVDVRSWYGSE